MCRFGMSLLVLTLEIMPQEFKMEALGDLNHLYPINNLPTIAGDPHSLVVTQDGAHSQ